MENKEFFQRQSELITQPSNCNLIYTKLFPHTSDQTNRVPFIKTSQKELTRSKKSLINFLQYATNPRNVRTSSYLVCLLKSIICDMFDGCYGKIYLLQ